MDHATTHTAPLPTIYRTADLVDAHGTALQVCDAQLRNLGGRALFHGPIRTVSCCDDNTLVRKALSEPAEGHVLVVDGGGSVRTALVGDVSAKLALENGWAGLIIWGAVRDIAAMSRLDIGVKAMATTPRRSKKLGAGTSGVPVAFGGVLFRPGDWLYSDEDGIVVSAHAL